MADFRRGMKAMQDSQESKKSGGKFPAFCPQIQWREDQEQKYVAFLNRPEDIPTVALHTFIPVGEWASGKPKYDEFIDRTDPGIGEASDELTDRLGRRAQQRSLAVAVELEPTYSSAAGGRRRPTGFAVKTDTFERKMEDGGTEEVTIPVLGLVVQSPRNFFGWVGSFHESTAPVEETPLQIIRRGKDQHTAYDFTPFMDQPIDYSNLFEYAGNMGYLREETLPESGGLEEALTIGELFLNKRLNELADKDRYDDLVGPITEIEDKFGGGQTFPAKRQSQREARSNGNGNGEAQSTSTNASKFDELRKIHEPA